ncbi:MAG: sporulation integral membrane protein YtvI, partial [Clostridia bacterium]|nr:sporulation integral membrane protein YtvI [Clostridia bacterium]
GGRLKFKERFETLNRDFNDLPRRLIWVAALLLALLLLVVSFRYIAPFVIGFAVALMIEPLVRLLTPVAQKIRLGRTAASLVTVLLVYGILIFLVVFLVNQVFTGVQALMPMIVKWVRSASAALSGWVASIETLELNGVSEDMLLRIGQEITRMLDQLGANAASFAIDKILPIAGYAMSTALSVSQVVLFSILSIASTFYFSSDREKIGRGIAKYMPDRMKARVEQLRGGVIQAVFGQLRATLVMFVVTAFELSVGFGIMGLDYAVLLALVIALLDALPVIGAGLVLIPMAIYGFVFGPIGLGIGSAVMYLVTIVVRQIVEPRVIGKQFGLHPLLTMIAMYVGYMVMNFMGMLLGPILALLCKAVFAGDSDETDPPRKAIRRKA